MYFCNQTGLLYVFDLWIIVGSFPVAPCSSCSIMDISSAEIIHYIQRMFCTQADGQIHFHQVSDSIGWFEGIFSGKSHRNPGKIDGFRLRFSLSRQPIDIGGYSRDSPFGRMVNHFKIMWRCLDHLAVNCPCCVLLFVSCNDTINDQNARQDYIDSTIHCISGVYIYI